MICLVSFLWSLLSTISLSLNMSCCFWQREPAEEALKSNNMNLDQDMSKCLCSWFFLPLKQHAQSSWFWAFDLVQFSWMRCFYWRCFCFCKQEALMLANSLPLCHLLESIFLFSEGALLEKKVEMDKRGMGVTDYNGMVTKPLGCRPPPISKESSMDRPTFLDKVGSEVWVWFAGYNCTLEKQHWILLNT